MKEKKQKINQQKNPYLNYKVMHSMDQKVFIKELLKTEEKSIKKKTLTEKLLENWKPGFTLGVISIPLSISMGVACGATPSASLISTVFFWNCNGSYFWLGIYYVGSYSFHFCSFAGVLFKI